MDRRRLTIVDWSLLLDDTFVSCAFVDDIHEGTIDLEESASSINLFPVGLQDALLQFETFFNAKTFGQISV